MTHLTPDPGAAPIGAPPHRAPAPGPQLQGPQQAVPQGPQQRGQHQQMAAGAPNPTAGQGGFGASGFAGPAPTPGGNAGWAGAPPGQPVGWAAPGGPGTPPGTAQAGPPAAPQAGPPGTPQAGSAPRTSGAAAVVCRLLALIATPLGLSIPFDSTCLWANATAWSVFAMLAALAQAAPLLASGLGWTVQRGWTVGAVGAAAVLLFWLLVALPDVGSNTGFTLTVAAAAAAAGSLLGPGRRL